MMTRLLRVFLLLVLSVASLAAQGGSADSLDAETLRHFQALVRMDTSDPPGNEAPAAAYLVKTLTDAGIDARAVTLEPNRPNVIARLPGSGRKRPILIMGHTDVVTVDAAKWPTHAPFSAARDGGYIYGRGTLDNKSSVVAGLMVMLELKRRNVALDRDVIFLAEAGEEGTTRVGIQFVVNQHFGAVDAEYCFAEGGGVTREGGVARFATVQTTEKLPRAMSVTARGISGHGSRPLESNAIVHLGAALAKIGAWLPPVRLNDTTRAYFERLSAVATGEQARIYRGVLDPAAAGASQRTLRATDPNKAAMLHATFSPTIVEGGYRTNVIPSEAKATVDVRLLPDDDPAAVLAAVTRVVDDPAVEIAWAARDVRPGGLSPIDSEAFQAIEAAVTTHYKVPTVPQMSTGATDMAYLRARGVQCYGIGPAVDLEDAPRGFGAHSDQERILEAELYRFVRFHYDVVAALAARH